MKIEFHGTRAAATIESIYLLAETEFEQQWLQYLTPENYEVVIEKVYPSHGKSDFNPGNNTCLRLKRKADK